MAPLSFSYDNRFRVRRFHAAPSPLRKPKNKIAAQIATFLRLGIVMWPPIADRSTKAQEISRKNEPFPLFGDRKEPLIEKSCRGARIFVFSLGKSPKQGEAGGGVRGAWWRAGRTNGAKRGMACGTDATTYAVRGVQNGNAMTKFHYFVRSGR